MHSKIASGVWLAMAALAHAQTTPRVEDLPDPLESDQRKILAQITDYALKYAGTLPDFVCTEVTRHNVDQMGTGQYWRLAGTIDGELSYSGHNETYKILKVNGKEDGNDHNLLGGFTAPDAFGELLSWIFDPKSKTSFKWNSWSTLEKRRTYVFAYTVGRENSQFAVTKAKGGKSLGFYGNVYADAETGHIMRINVVGQAPAVPAKAVKSPNAAKTGIGDISFDVDYALTKVGDKEYPLPSQANFRLRNVKTLIWDEIEFHHYQRLGADPNEKFSQRKP
jgi:hypothetical protein